MEVHLTLRKRYGDALGVEAQLDPLRQVPLQGPESSGFTHGRTAMFTLLSSSSCTKTTGAGSDSTRGSAARILAQYLYDLATVVGIAHAENEIDAQPAEPV